MTKALITTAVQTGGGMVALETIGNVDPVNVQNQIIAVVGSLIVSVVRWALFKYVFKKEQTEKPDLEL